MNTSQPAPALKSEERKIAILPIGSCEQHGPFLPIDTDLRIAQLLAKKLADSIKKFDPILFPAVPFSCSWEHKGLGTIAVNISTLSAILHDFSHSLKTWDMPILLILVNWHGGNDLLGALSTEISATEDIPTAVVPSISQVGKAWDESDITSAKEIHAGAVETSIIQAYWPGLISKAIRNDEHCEPSITPAKAQAVLQSIGIRAVTKDGIWGAPEEADTDKGKKLVVNLVQKMHDQTLKLLELVNKAKSENEGEE